MAKTKKKSHSTKPRGYSHSSYKGKKHTGNPGHHKTTHHKKYHRGNPGFANMGSTVVTGFFVIAGALGSKLGTQMVLGSNNTGLIGYAGNAAAGGILWGIARFMKASKPVTDGLIFGTIVQIILRVINDYTPFGQYVAQLGMGDYQMQSFVTPQILVDPWRNADIQVPNGWGPGPQAMLPAAPAGGAAGTAPAAVGRANGGGGMAGLYGGGWGGGLYG